MLQLFLIFVLVCVSSAQNVITTIPSSVDQSQHLATGYVGLIVQATFTLPRTATCNWVYSNVSQPFFLGLGGCINSTTKNEEITCARTTNIVSDLNFTSQATLDHNIEMRCTDTGGIVLNLSIAINVTDCPTSLPGDLEVTVNSGGGAVYNSMGEFTCASGDLTELNDNPISTTTCQADATWTNQENILCTVLPRDTQLTDGEKAAIGVAVVCGCIIIWVCAATIWPPMGGPLKEPFKTVNKKIFDEEIQNDENSCEAQTPLETNSPENKNTENNTSTKPV